VSHDGNYGDTCKFGHVFEVYDHDDTGAPNGDIRNKIEKGEISSLDDLRNEIGTDHLKQIMGDTYKQLKVSAGTQGTPYMVAWTAADKFDEDLDYTVEKTSEDLFISPQNQLHDELMQRKQQAEQRVNQTLSGLSDLRKQKHMLQHDIRKLRSRAEAFGANNETQLKADFVELVDGAGGGAQQGSDEAPLKTLRDQNIYPSIVADFYEMDSVDDLKKAEQLEDSDDDGDLAHLPANEKAILRKKWVMYEKWKDLYGSEIQRKLQDLKSQMRNIERSIKETEKWLEPYVRDATMINSEDPDDMAEKMTFYPTLKGSASMRRDLEFICYRPMKKHNGQVEVIEDESEATHFRIVYIHTVHANLAGGEQPQSPAQGPSSATVMYHSGIVCRHVFENFFKAKINKQKNRFKNMLDDYTGGFSSNEKGEQLKSAREKKNWSVRKLRKEVSEQVDENAPIELSSYIRRVEDGLDGPEVIADEFGEDYLHAIEEVLDITFEGEHGREEMYSGIAKTLRKFTGQTDRYVIPSDQDLLGELNAEIKYKYYYDYKLGLGLYTMK
jgi:hypothetical protein